MEELLQLLQLQMEQGGRAALTVTGSSMLPMLTPLRDRVWLEPIRGELRSGDVILYRRENGQYVLHRIIKLSCPLICCGDNQWQKETVQPQQLLAVVTAWETSGKHRTLQSLTYRLYTWLMVSFFPLRRPYIAIRRQLGKIRRRIK